MSEPQRPWREGVPKASDESVRRAAEVVASTHRIEPRPVELSAGWNGVLQRVTRSGPSTVTLVLGGLVAASIGVVVTVAVMRARAPAATVVASSGTQWARQQDGAVQLQRGQLKTVRRVSLRLESPQVSVVATDCSFAAEVIAEGTRVAVFEGTAVVRSGEGVERTLAAGESALWPATPEIAPSLSAGRPGAVVDASCSDVACFEQAARGDDLKAEVALFELARRQPDRAVEHWRRSLERFPDGVFVPEVRLALMVALTRQGRFAEALDQARSFEASAPDDPRVDDVRRLRRQLEWLGHRR